MFTRIRRIGWALGLFLAATTGMAETRLIFPRIVFQSGLYSGIAMSNPTASAATIKLTAYNLDGTKLSTTGTKNDVAADLPSGGQYLTLASQIFDPSSVLTGSAPKYCWVEVTSATTGLAGFYLEFDAAVTFQSGGDLGTFGTDVYLPAVDNTGTSVTEISLVNADTTNNGGDASVTVDFLRSDGTKLDSKSVVIQKGGSLQGPLGSIPALSSVSYGQVVAMRVRSDRPVLCYGIVKPQSGRAPIALPAEDVTTPAKTLYFPQLANGRIPASSEWATSLGIANLNFSSQTLVNITAYKPDGTLWVDPTITNPKSVPIPAGGFLRASFNELFPFTDGSYKEGWLKVEANTPAINGFIEYGSGNNRALVIAQLNPFQRSMFSHQAQGASTGGRSYFTGLAVLNPGTLAANVEVFSLDGQGNTLGRVQTVLKPGQRTSQLLYQLVSESAKKNGGSVFVRSDRPVFATELFANDDVSALANVPPQQVTASFEPKSNLPKITPVPPLAVVETGKTRQFTAPGVSGGVQWLVNGTKGDATIGTISDTGLYTAPSKAPAPRTLTIQAAATTGNNSGASSIDVVQREKVAGGLTLVTAVAYLEGSNRFFVAEQQLLSVPAGAFAAANANSQISEVVKSGSGTANTPFLSVTGDTIAKMLPYESGSTSSLLLAGRDSGKIYRLDVASKALMTVVSGLNQPTSMAFDPTTGNVLVAEAGAGQITIVTAGQIAAAAEPSATLRAASEPQGSPAVSVPDIRGIAVDKCTGTVYVTLASGELNEYQGSSKRVVETGLDKPTQLQAVYREGFSCATALTLAIVEATKVSLSYPKAQITRATLIDDTVGVSDITFFPPGNPFTTGGEASLGIAQASPTANQGQVSDVLLGGIYRSAPPKSFATAGLFGGAGPNEDPIGDTFGEDLAAQWGLSLPDIVSVTGSTQGGQSVITIKFAAPVTLGSAPTGQALTDGLWAFIFMKTTAGSQVISQFPAPLEINLPDYFPFGNPGVFFYDSILGVFDGESVYASATGQSVTPRVSAIGNTLTISVPTTALDLRDTTAVVLVGPPAFFSDVAPNNGVLKLTP